MFIERLELHNFRNYQELSFEPTPSGVIAIIGKNGQGKTSLMEALGYLSNKTSFRGATKEFMISYQSDEAVIRGSFQSSLGRKLLVEASMSKTSRDRFLINKQPQSKLSFTNRVVPVTIFASLDIEVVRGAPSLRRGYLDTAIEMLYPKGASVITNVEKILRQRAVLLKQSGGSPTPDVLSTLEVWDQQLSVYGTQLVDYRRDLVNKISPYVKDSYNHISGSDKNMSLRYRCSWEGDLYKELYRNRREDLKRQSNGIGPHRDDLEINLDGHQIRHHGSQGEQRTSAYALKVALHSLYRDQSSEDPILLLDDVFSELDESRSEAILSSVRATQIILTTTGNIPTSLVPTKRVFVNDGRVVDTL